MNQLFDAPVQVSLQEQILCVQREISMRERVYPRFTITGRMKMDVADREIESMKAVLGTLLKVRDAL